MGKSFKPRPIRELLESRKEQEEREAAIGGEIRAMRVSRGMTQSFLAEQAGVTPPYLNRIEKGHKSPSDRTLRRLVDVLEEEEGAPHDEGKDAD